MERKIQLRYRERCRNRERDEYAQRLGELIICKQAGHRGVTGGGRETRRKT